MDSENYSVHNTKEGVHITQSGGQLTSDYTAQPGGVEISTRRRVTHVANKDDVQTVGRDKALTCRGNNSRSVNGVDEARVSQSMEIVGTTDMANSGAVAAVNDLVRARIALQSQAATTTGEDNPGDGWGLGMVKRRLSGTLTGVTHSTTTPTGAAIAPYRATGNVAKDLVGMIDWYSTMLKNYVMENVVQRAILCIRSEVEKIRAQVAATESIADEMYQHVKNLRFSKLGSTSKQLLSSPSDQNKPKRDNLTKGAAVESMGSSDEIARRTQLERRA